MPLTYVIFDCDGVLVDSETLSARVLMSMMAEIGLPIDDAIFRADFLGRSFASAAQRAEARFGRPMPDDFQLRYRDRLLSVMRQELRPMPGVKNVLNAMTAPFALATGSSPQRLSVTLEVTGLAAVFENRCTTSSEVERGKPAPDLCWLVARKLGARPENCLVIEDSLMGIESGLAAGMQVWRFLGGSHMRAEDREETPTGVRLIADMRELQAALAAAGLCRPPASG